MVAFIKDDARNKKVYGSLQCLILKGMTYLKINPDCQNSTFKVKSNMTSVIYIYIYIYNTQYIQN